LCIHHLAAWAHSMRYMVRTRIVADVTIQHVPNLAERGQWHETHVIWSAGGRRCAGDGGHQAFGAVYGYDGGADFDYDNPYSGRRHGDDHDESGDVRHQLCR